MVRNGITWISWMPRRSQYSTNRSFQRSSWPTVQWQDRIVPIVPAMPHGQTFDDATRSAGAVRI